MGEFRLNAVRTDTDESVDFIDLREPITAAKLIRGRETLEARVALKFGECPVAGLVEIKPDIDALPDPSDFTISGEMSGRPILLVHNFAPDLDSMAEVL